MPSMKTQVYSLLVLIFFIVPLHASLAKNSEVLAYETTTEKAKVLEVISQVSGDLDGIGIQSSRQSIKVQILTGDEKGKEVTFNNDYVMLSKGEVFFIDHTINSDDGSDYYKVNDPNRLPVLYILIGLFLVVVIVFGGIQGIRGLASLAGSFLLILFVLVPAILNGYSPVFVSIGVSSLIIIIGSYITHGFNKTTTAAVFGMLITVIITGVLAHFAVVGTHLTGLTEEAVYLNSSTAGSIDLVGLLFGGIMIGLLGVLYDISISQAISVEELHKIAPHVPRRNIYKRAIRIGREHIGALVDTLAIAYVGAALPLLLLVHHFGATGGAGQVPIINQEIFATEIVRILIGSIGLILAVPITTFISSYMLIKLDTKVVDPKQIEIESELLKHAGHHH